MEVLAQALWRHQAEQPGLGAQLMALLSLTGAATSIIFSREIRVCREKKYACRNKIMSVATNICRDKSFVATNIILSRQKHTFVATRRVVTRETRVCRDKNDTCGSSHQ